MIFTPVHPHLVDAVDLSGDGARAALRELYNREPATPWLRVNVITSVDGSIQGVDGTSSTLSNPADRALLGAIRAESDIVLVGAATFRTEGYFVPRTARLAVVTGSGDLSGAATDGITDPRRILVLGPESARQNVATTLGAPHTFAAIPDVGGEIDLAAALDHLREHGGTRVVCEGGAALIAALSRKDLVDEYCVSTAAIWTGGGAPLLASGPAHAKPLVLAALATDEVGTIYTRWLVTR